MPSKPPLSNPKNASSSSSNSKPTSSAIGATLLIAQQFGSRALTFIVNQILLRYLSPSLLGISTQLEVYSITVLFFARESLRVAIQRQADIADASPRTEDEDEKSKIPKGHVDALTSAGRTQAIVNLSYISVFLGAVFAVVVAWLYSWSLAAGDPAVLATPYFPAALKLFGLAALGELLAEPCYVVVQHKSRFGVRARTEMIATVLRCLVTCGSAIWAARTGRDIGVLPFALGQCTYAVSLLVVYYASVWSIASSNNFSLFLNKIYTSNPSSYLLSYFSLPLLKLTASFFTQSILKHLLTQGDTILISLLTTPTTQGIYALASAYGGLIARLLLQPIEETTRNHIGKRLSSPSQPSVLEVRQTLLLLLRTYILISLLLVTIGPLLASPLLSLIAGSRWTSSGAGHVLAMYCYYIPLLAINGLTEAFVSSVATQRQLGAQTLWMFVFSFGFALASFLFLGVLDWGAEGLVAANGLNMLVRIVWAWGFMGTYFRGFGTRLRVSELLPKPVSLAAAVGTWGVLVQVEKGFSGGVMDLVKGGVVAAGLVVVVAIAERAHFMECYREFRGQKA
ncbi:Rft-1-domain-containing protein [Mollisia scopiformis]|uniref:Man(5)GlcNAc(2)-PP-dolichol translocation protein RFT1 n=1 Tax=Mollisia scopiformis TaxID=149040 RepID=A0A194X6J0_MOLSC|nr:Rft-1-domain-containing protein [Mollisia scopiformis]KUJ15699.1 Rft-1-domain-containing protein [Mollisia scopiformis]